MIDVLYILSMNNGDSSALSRLQKSIQSLRGGTKPFRLCLADSSRIPVLDKIKTLDIGDYEYIHCPKDDPYNRSYNINAGVKALIKAKMFWLSDIDIIYENSHLEACMDFAMEYDYLTFSMDKIQYDGDVKRVEAGGGFFCKTEYFYTVRGFDERYVGWGAEDNDFTDRIMFAGANVKRWIKRPILTHMWHFTNKTDNELIQANKDRLFELRRQIEYGKFKPELVNPDGWGIL